MGTTTLAAPAAPPDTALVDLFERLAREAGEAILAVRRQGFETETKGDASPVTRADRAAERIILDGLRAAHPGLAIVAEEEASDGLAPDTVGRRFVLVDPLDGTREFVRGGEDFTVNIALVEDGVPVAGVVLQPVTDRLYSGDARGARLNGVPIRCRPAPECPVIVASRSHRTAETDAWIARVEARCGPCETVSVGSSLKFCLLAEGRADLYPRFGRTMEWDTAAGDAVLRAAGGVTLHPDGRTFGYGKPAGADVAFANGWFVAGGARRALEGLVG